MARHITKDVTRYRDIIKGKLRKDLRKYITNKGIVGKHGKRFVRIPMPTIDIPRLRYGKSSEVKQGKGQGPEAGDQPGEHALEVEVSMEELAKLLGEELQLPNIKPKGRKQLEFNTRKYRGISVTGPESLRHVKRTLKEALKREISSGIYTPGDPVIPVKRDKRYRSYKTIFSPVSNAAIFYIMDISASIGDHEKNIVRTLSFWIDTWIRHNYKHVKSEYIVHDTRAAVVPRDHFYSLTAGGGTFISSGLKAALKLIEQKYPHNLWNIYVFYFGDGDNWQQDNKDTEKATINLAKIVNQFGYAQVNHPAYTASAWGSIENEYASITKRLQKEFSNIVTTKIEELDQCLDVIKIFLGGGR